MFRKSKPSQGDLFKSISNQVSNRKLQMLEDPAGWHNVFYDQVVRRIDESIFSVLYNESTGRPNASLRVLVGMMILKEGNGWSDEQLFEECRFNLKVMRALGLQNLDEDVPAESTWYDFRRSLVRYSGTHDTDLMKLCFQGITAEQIALHSVSGRKVRMDSKLINSNISTFSRVELILEVVRVFICPLPLEPLQKLLASGDMELLGELKKKSVSNITYPLSASQQKELLHSLGYLIRQLLEFYREQGVAKYELLERVWTEQYRVEQTGGGDDQPPKLTLLPAEEISSSSLQSPHDPQATFRSKGNGKTKKMVAGYHANITETCDEDNAVNLIVDADVQAANTGEHDFLLPTLQASQKVLQQAAGQEQAAQIPHLIEHISSDGGYDSVDNREAMSKPGAPHWNLSNVKGKQANHFFYHDHNGQLQAQDRRTGQGCGVTFSERARKYVIQSDNQQKRYFTPDQIHNALLRQQIEARQRPEDRSIRANVEATIHQVFHRLQKREKVKYRGHYRSQCYVLCRALWANFRRISQKNLADSLVFDFFGLWSAWKAHIMTWLLCQRTSVFSYFNSAALR